MRERVREMDVCHCCKKPIDHLKEMAARNPVCAHMCHVECDVRGDPDKYNTLASVQSLLNKTPCAECKRLGHSATTERTTTTVASDRLESVRKEARTEIKRDFKEFLAERRGQMVELRAYVANQLSKERPRTEHVCVLFDTSEAKAQTLFAQNNMSDVFAVHRITLDKLLSVGLSLAEIHTVYNVKNFEDLVDLGFSCDKHLSGARDDKNVCLIGDLITLYGVTWEDMHEKANFTAGTLTKIKFDGADLALAEISMDVLFNELGCSPSTFAAILGHCAFELNSPLTLETLVALGLSAEHVALVTGGGNLDRCINKLGWNPAKVRLLFGIGSIKDHTDPTGKLIISDLLGHRDDDDDEQKLAVKPTSVPPSSEQDYQHVPISYYYYQQEPALSPPPLSSEIARRQKWQELTKRYMPKSREEGQGSLMQRQFQLSSSSSSSSVNGPGGGGVFANARLMHNGGGGGDNRFFIE